MAVNTLKPDNASDSHIRGMVPVAGTPLRHHQITKLHHRNSAVYYPQITYHTAWGRSSCMNPLDLEHTPGTDTYQ